MTYSETLMQCKRDLEKAAHDSTGLQEAANILGRVFRLTSPALNLDAKNATGDDETLRSVLYDVANRALSTYRQVGYAPTYR